jgi:hypothetical protein
MFPTYILAYWSARSSALRSALFDYRMVLGWPLKTKGLVETCNLTCLGGRSRPIHGGANWKGT